MWQVSQSKTESESARRLKIIFLIPVYDDWKSLYKLLEILDAEFAVDKLTVDILVVDDGSQNSFDESYLPTDKLKTIDKISILELRRNLGHQRAVALGLTFAEDNLDSDIVLVMDGDGEDTPAEARHLIERCAAENFSRTVFARRAKRSENWRFRAFYEIYKIIYRLLTGQNIRFGNFSAVPSGILSRIVATPEIWNHYAAAVLKARIPYTEIDTRRGLRLDGSSKMNFVSLVIHGLSAISVYAEVIGIRLLISTVCLTVGTIFLIGVVLAVRLLTDIAVPGWATYVIALLIVILLQSITLSLFFSFLVLTGRNNAIFFPQQDYKHFIREKYEIRCRNGESIAV